MTLKEKFKPFVFYVTESFNVARENNKEKNATECEQIADDYAISFTDWVNVNAYKYPTNTTTKELLEIFKKEKGL